MTKNTILVTIFAFLGAVGCANFIKGGRKLPPQPTTTSPNTSNPQSTVPMTAALVPGKVETQGGDCTVTPDSTFLLDLATPGVNPTNAFWMIQSAKAFAGGDAAVRAQYQKYGFKDVRSIVANAGSGNAQNNCAVTGAPGKGAIQGYVAGKDDLIVVGFSGGGELKDHLTNFNFITKSAGSGASGWILTGLDEQLANVLPCLTNILTGMNAAQKPIYVTGHGVGGSLASVIGWKLVKANYNVAGVYSFGQPKMGNETFAQLVLSEMNGKLHRYVFLSDFLPHFPPHPNAAEIFAGMFPVQQFPNIRNIPVGPIGQFAAVAALKWAKYTHSVNYKILHPSGEVQDMSDLDSGDVGFYSQLQQRAQSSGVQPPNFLTLLASNADIADGSRIEKYSCALAVSYKKSKGLQTGGIGGQGQMGAGAGFPPQGGGFPPQGGGFPPQGGPVY